MVPKILYGWRPQDDLILSVKPRLEHFIAASKDSRRRIAFVIRAFCWFYPNKGFCVKWFVAKEVSQSASHVEFRSLKQLWQE